MRLLRDRDLDLDRGLKPAASWGDARDCDGPGRIPGVQWRAQGIGRRGGLTGNKSLRGVGRGMRSDPGGCLAAGRVEEGPEGGRGGMSVVNWKIP
jgi:hypothetical protein